MAEEIIIKGFWWLPNSLARIPGILTYKPFTKLVLELFGNLEVGSDPIEKINTIQQYDLIHGISSNGKKISVIYCINISSSISSNSPFAIKQYQGQFLIIGKHILDINEKCYNRSVVKIPQLYSWCRSNNIKHSVENGLLTYSYNLGNLDTIAETNINKNLNILIKSGVDNSVKHSDGGMKFSLREYSYIEFRCKNTSLQEIYKYIRFYEQFLSLATLSYIQCSNITLYDSNINEYTNEVEKQIQYIYVQNKEKEILNSDKYSPLFTYEQIKDIYPQILIKWYEESEKFSPIRGHLIECIKYKATFTELDFLIVIQAIEGFYYRFIKDGENLSTVLTNLINKFSDIDIIRNNEINVQASVDSRHYYSHFMPEGKKKHVLNSKYLFFETYNLRILLVCCALDFIGLNHQKIDLLLNATNNSIIKNRYLK